MRLPSVTLRAAESDSHPSADSVLRLRKEKAAPDCKRRRRRREQVRRDRGCQWSRVWVVTREGIDEVVAGREMHVRARTSLVCLLGRMAKRGIVWTVRGEAGIVCCVEDGLGS